MPSYHRPSMRLRTPVVAPSTYRQVTFGALLALAFIVVTGGAVRLTGSGLGCPDWPTCSDQRLVAPWEYHAMVEFVNRAITGLVSVAVMLAVLGSVFRRPRRRDLVWLSLGLVGGVIGQIVLGGMTVRYHLKPQLVMAHFLLSMVLLANAVVLHERAGDPEGETGEDGGSRRHARPTTPPVPELAPFGHAIVAMTALVLFLGTVVTSSGPHGGDPNVERLPFLVPDVARLHGSAVIALLGLTLLTLWRLTRSPGGRPLMGRAEAFLAVLVVQGGIGYLQYFTGVPPVIVGFHIAGAAATWVTAVRFQQGFRTAVSEPPRE